jgi:hypothetical protein
VSRTALATACVCAIAFALAGCDGDDGSSGAETNEFTAPSPSADEFVAAANEICTETEKAAELYNEEIEQEGLHSPESVRYLRRAASARERGLTRLRELTPTPEDAEEFEEFLRAYEVNLVKLEVVTAAIERGDVEEAQTVEEDINASTEEESDPLAAELGIDECASG